MFISNTQIYWNIFDSAEFMVVTYFFNQLHIYFVQFFSLRYLNEWFQCQPE